MFTISPDNENTSQPAKFSHLTGHMNSSDTYKDIPNVCLACSVEENRELPQVCTMQPCPKHRQNKAESSNAVVDEAFVAQLDRVCTALVQLRAPASIINPLRTALTSKSLTAVLSAAQFWIVTQRIEVVR